MRILDPVAPVASPEPGPAGLPGPSLPPEQPMFEVTPAPPAEPHRPPRRAHPVARAGGRLASRLSKLCRLGEGWVIGGEVALRLAPDIGSDLAQDLEIIVVSGTNGKTTVTRLIADALAHRGTVVSNRTGANLTNGVVGALLSEPRATIAVLEIDEAVLPWALEALRPTVAVLLNLSRDQLDRLHEVRATAELWSTALQVHPPGRVIANADDPLVVLATGDVPATWVAAGLSWDRDASSCPWCGDPVDFADAGWRCESCGHRRPPCHAELEGDQVRLGARHRALDLPLPGRSVRANAAMALTVVEHQGASITHALERWRQLDDIEGRYQVTVRRGHPISLHLAKNPAGWSDTLDLLGQDDLPIVIALNARSEDGRDPSWIWDVPFERLAGRSVVCLGERRTDLLVRLSYAEVECTTAASLDDALDLLAAGPAHVVANYSAFQAIRSAVRRAR